MLRLIVATFAVLCLMGTNSLAMADEGARYGDQQKSAGDGAQYCDQIEPARADNAMKGKEKEHKEKKKKRKDTAKAAPAAPAPAAKP